MVKASDFFRYYYPVPEGNRVLVWINVPETRCEIRIYKELAEHLEKLIPFPHESTPHTVEQTRGADGTILTVKIATHITPRGVTKAEAIRWLSAHQFLSAYPYARI